MWEKPAILFRLMADFLCGRRMTAYALPVLAGSTEWTLVIHINGGTWWCFRRLMSVGAVFLRASQIESADGL